jgi:hypothetical protein
MTADLIARLRAGTVTPADLDAAADALERLAMRHAFDIERLQREADEWCRELHKAVRELGGRNRL